MLLGLGRTKLNMSKLALLVKYCSLVECFRDESSIYTSTQQDRFAVQQESTENGSNARPMTKYPQDVSGEENF